jgi:protein TonB
MLRPEFSVARHDESSPPDESVRDLASGDFVSANGAAVVEPAALDPIVSDLLVEVCAQTGASGAALALEGEDGFYCRGAIGATAPDVGLRIDAGHGLTAECLRSGLLQVCDNAERDFRVDRDACQRLGIRSFVVAPLLVDGYPRGLLAVYSPIVRAFGSLDLQRLEVLTRRIVTLLSHPRNTPEPSAEVASQEGMVAAVESPVPPPAEMAAAVAAETSVPPPEGPGDRHAVEPIPVGNLFASAIPDSVERKPWLNRLLAAMVVAAAVVLGWMSSASYHTRSSPHGVVQAAKPPAAAVPAKPQGQTTDAVPLESKPAANPPLVPASQSSPVAKPSALGELVIYEKNRVIFRERPIPTPSPAGETTVAAVPSGAPSTSPDALAANLTGESTTQKIGDQPAGQIVSHPPAGLTGGQILYRVPPVAPPEASQLGLHGDVVLQVTIAKDGTLGAIRPVSGDPRLIPAAVDAVRQWRYQPFLQNGNAVEVQGKITIHFGKSQ